ncbi:hypothetical protein BV898_13203 [Hypsibius exemplaris]|uniref:J domain-containing protein n=1 Tax=Hypsibius exemplaris TaxID=2072580 RepID=A0A1W0WBH1_HYPEX|nr:hypothetical protein BV898_13203 [Hypsibius exemplaris]
MEFLPAHLNSKDHYALLGVSRNATSEEIIQARRKLMKQYHPDKYEGDKMVADLVAKRVNTAFEILMSGEDREDYDETVPGFALPLLTSVNIVAEEFYKLLQTHNTYRGPFINFATSAAPSYKQRKPHPNSNRLVRDTSTYHDPRSLLNEFISFYAAQYEKEETVLTLLQSAIVETMVSRYFTAPPSVGGKTAGGEKSVYIMQLRFFNENEKRLLTGHLSVKAENFKDWVPCIDVTPKPEPTKNINCPSCQASFEFFDGKVNYDFCGSKFHEKCSGKNNLKGYIFGINWFFTACDDCFVRVRSVYANLWMEIALQKLTDGRPSFLHFVVAARLCRPKVDLSECDYLIAGLDREKALQLHAFMIAHKQL